MKKEKMIVEIYQNGKKVNEWTDEENIKAQLMGLMWQKLIIKSRNIRIKYSYNYSDMQKITFVNSYENYDGTITKTEYIFENVPTNLGFLDTYKMFS